MSLLRCQKAYETIFWYFIFYLSKHWSIEVDSESDDHDDDDVDTVPMLCPLDEREELHLPEQIIDDASLFVVNVTSDVSNQEQQSQIDEGQPDLSASSYESSIVVENNQNQNRYWKK